MVSASKLNHLIDKAGRKSSWEGAHVDMAALAHTARVQHAVETLVQLGHDNLAAELLRRERQAYDEPPIPITQGDVVSISGDAPIPISEFPPAA